MVTNEYDALTLILSTGYRCNEDATGIVKMEETDPELPLQSVSLKTKYKDVSTIII